MEDGNGQFKLKKILSSELRDSKALKCGDRFCKRDYLNNQRQLRKSSGYGQARVELRAQTSSMRQSVLENTFLFVLPAAQDAAPVVSFQAGINSKMDTICPEYMKEQLRLFRKWHPLGCIARPLRHDDGSVNYAIWECAVPGRKGTHWEGGLFKRAQQKALRSDITCANGVCAYGCDVCTRHSKVVPHVECDIASEMTLSSSTKFTETNPDEERTMMMMGPPGPPPPYSEEPPSSQELVRPTDEPQLSVHNDDPHRVVEASHQETNSQLFMRPPRLNRSAPPPYTPRSEPTHNPDREANNDSADVKHPQRRPRKPKEMESTNHYKLDRIEVRNKIDKQIGQQFDPTDKEAQ
ncbi:hypothetical protein COOONC_04971 [Cooperia oncophora]